MSDSTKSGATPYPLAILLCDSIYVDERSKKKVLVGLFDNINVEEFPSVHKPLAIYVRLTDAEGEYDFRFDYVHVSSDELLGQGTMDGIVIEDRLKPHDLIMEPPPIPLPKPGEYEFRLYANERYIGRVKFTVTQINKK